MEKLVDGTCTDFAERLASAAPVPGGGGAAALTGALGAALCGMAGSLTVRKKKYASVEQDIVVLLEEAKEIRLRLLALVDEDARGFEPLKLAYALPKDDPAREETLRLASLAACEAPLAMMRACCRATKLLDEMEQKGSELLVSDVGCGAALCRAALIAASMNVFVNTKSLTCPEAYKIEQEADALLQSGCKRAETVLELAMGRIRRNR